MRFGDYFASKAVTLCFLGLGALLLAIFMSVSGTGADMLVLAVCFLLLLTLGWLLSGFFLACRRLAKLERISQELKDKYLLGELLPPPAGAVERQYFEIMKTVSRSAIGLAEQARREKEDYCDYVESWIHEIKTPLTACSLILANGADPRKLKRELTRADNLTESILYYARMRTAEKDTQIRVCHVAEVIDEAVKSQMELLIAAHISVQVSGDFPVHTDSKSLCFILKQLLINCAKYCPACRVTMTAANGTITVEDNGAGIPRHELARVTDRGFTGTNGRKFGGSTGMGLYIVRELCTRLGIALEIDSEAGWYTRVMLRFGPYPCQP